MNEELASFSEEDKYIIEAGYKPQLHRKLTPFSSFAISFSLMSVLVGVFATYAFVLQTAGPFGIWTWPVVVCGQFFIALVFADLASRVPLTGSIYHWNKKLGGATFGWQAGWIMIFASSVGGVSAVVALMPPLQSLIGFTFTAFQLQILGLALIAIQLSVNIFGVRFAGQINKYAVLLEIVCLVAISASLLIAAALHAGFHPAWAFTIPSSPKPYLPAFLMSGLLGVFTLIGFESPSDVSEETIDARKIAPRSILRSIPISGVLGFLFLITLTAVIPNAQILSSADPVGDIVQFYLGTFAAKLLLACVVIAIFAASILVIMYVSRLAFAIARDNRIVGAKYLSHVSSRGVPVWSAVFVTCIEVVIFLFAAGQTALFAANSVLFCVGYLITIVNFARSSSQLPEGNFSLGKWRPFIVTIAIVWLLFEISVLTIPADFHLAGLVAIGVILSGFVLQFLFGKNA